MCSTMFWSGDDTISLGVAIVFVFVSGSEGQIIKPAGIFKSVYHKNEPVLADRLKFYIREQNYAFSRARVRVVMSQTSAGP